MSEPLVDLLTVPIFSSPDHVEVTLTWADSRRVTGFVSREDYQKLRDLMFGLEPPTYERVMNSIDLKGRTK